MKPVPILSLFCGIYLLVGCATTQVEKGLYAPCQCTYAIERDNQGRKQGHETWWYSDGKKKYAAVFKAGTRDGKFTSWYSSGKTWYEGFEKMGRPESTLTYWNQDGSIRSQAFFRNGIQLERRDYDAEGRLIGTPSHVEPESLAVPDVDKESRVAGERLRQAALKVWAMRVRQTVEGYWALPTKFEQERPYRAIAKIKVGRDGKILGITWAEKSPSADFNALAKKVFKRIHRLPAFPAQIQESSLEIQYEFISLGKQIKRRKLEVRETSPGGPADP